MATVEALTLLEGDDPVVTIEITLDGAAWDLTTAVVELLVKKDARTADTDALLTYSSAGVSPRITVQAPASAGVVLVDFAGQVPSAGTYWHRVTVTDNSRRTTVRYGLLVVTDT